MSALNSMTSRISHLSPLEWCALAASALIGSFLLIDPLVYGVVRDLDPDIKDVFQRITHLGRSSWVLIPTGMAAIILLGLRTRDIGARTAVAYGYVAQISAYIFGCVAGAGIITSLGKNIIGRARPKLYDAVGSMEFDLFAFHADFASFPSGHSTTIFALAGALAVLFPRARTLLLLAAAWIAASRFMIGAHFFSDTVAGMTVGLAFSQFLTQRMAERRWLFQRAETGGVRLRGDTMASWIWARVRNTLTPG